MGASITLAGESLIAQKQGTQQPLNVARFIFANVPGLNPNSPVDRAAAKPPAAQVVYSYAIPPDNVGYVNPNQVVYSSMLGSDIGDFDFNWIGLETSENVLFAVAYIALQQKRRNIPPQQIGNNVTRNILVEFNGAQALTGVTIDANTWQHDFTVRLAGIDERERLANQDMYGAACFFGNGFKMEKTASGYQLSPGGGYFQGIRVVLYEPLPVAVPSTPNTAWLDVALERHLNDVVGAFKVVFGTGLVDYTDSAGTRHYVTPLASLPSSSIVTDLRSSEPINVRLVEYFAARNGDYQNLRARATTKADVGLDQIPNALSDDKDADSSSVLATTRMVQAVRALLKSAITALVDGSTAAGRAVKLVTARTFSFTGAVTGSATFDGSSDAAIALTLADSGVAAGSYTKVSVNMKGLVIGGSNPTTLAAYGIEDAYTKADAVKAFVKQGAGAGQLSNSVGIGWSSDGLKAAVDVTDLGTFWLSSNFDPNTKANASDVYTKTQTATFLNQKVSGDTLTDAGFVSGNAELPYFRHQTTATIITLATATELNKKATKATSLAGYGIADAYSITEVNAALAARVAGDAVSIAGFANGNAALPYFRHKDGTLHYLQPALGFDAVQQGGGANHGNNKLRLGWSLAGYGLRAQVDNTDVGLLWGENNFYRPDANNFFPIGIPATSFQLPAGGTWCYSAMHYFADGRGVVGKSGIAAGGTVISFSGGSTIYGFAWRYSV